MSYSSNLQAGINNIVAKAGTSVRIRYFNPTMGSVWDDEATLNDSDTVIIGSNSELTVNLEGTYPASGTSLGVVAYGSGLNEIRWFNDWVIVYSGTVGGHHLWAMAGSQTSAGGEYLPAGNYDPTSGTAVATIAPPSVWASGIVVPVTAREGSNESVLLQQGKLIDTDQRLYMNGSIPVNGSTYLVDIQIGSPIGDLYTTIPEGGLLYTAQGESIYKKQYIRRLTGSLT